MIITRYLTKTCLWLGLLLVLSLLVACSQTKYGVVKIVTIPSGAEVINLRDDTHLGRTPLLVTWEDEDDTARNATVELRKAGFVEEITTFWVNMRHDTKEAAILEPQPVTIELRKRN
jgi:hypothetical protein